MHDVTHLKELPFFSCDNIGSDTIKTNIEEFKSHTDSIIVFKKNHPGKFSFLHLNFNSVFNKVHELDEILNLCRVDIFSINESKLGESVPNSWYSNKFYKCLRLDRIENNGGGILVFIRN